MENSNILAKIDSALTDHSVPRRVRDALENVKSKIQKDGKSELALTYAIYEIESLANDVNLPMHIKTTVWDIISELESQKAKK